MTKETIDKIKRDYRHECDKAEEIADMMQADGWSRVTADQMTAYIRHHALDTLIDAVQDATIDHMAGLSYHK